MTEQVTPPAQTPTAASSTAQQTASEPDSSMNGTVAGTVAESGPINTGENTRQDDGTSRRRGATDSPTAPIADDGPAVVCQRCGTPAPAGTTNCVKCGVFLPRNEGHVTHGLRRYQRTGVLPPDLKTDIDSFRANVISDQGGLDELPAIRAGLIRLLVDCEVGKRLWMNEVIRRGVDSRPGRNAYDKLLATMDRWMRVAAALGVERQQRDISIHDYITQAEPQQAQQGAYPPAWGENTPDRELTDRDAAAQPAAADKEHSA